ncbi:DUF2470 domain-containing protein [Alishewanella longhuensis]
MNFRWWCSTLNDDHADACALIAAKHSGQSGAATLLTVYPDGCHFMQAERLSFLLPPPALLHKKVRKAWQHAATAA